MRLPNLSALEGWLAEQEAQVLFLRDGAQKQVIWAGKAATQTDTSIVVIHGFSAAAPEMRPVPDLVAKALGANLYFTRLDGHGADGGAMGRATFDQWMATAHETLDIGRMLGRQVVMISCSTGCPLAIMAAGQNPQGVAAHICVSPNFRLRSALARGVFALPAFEILGKLIIGRQRTFRPRSLDHAKHWTIQYPFEALVPLRDTLRAFEQVAPEAQTIPALMLISEEDQTIDPVFAREVSERWGASSRTQALELGKGDDPGRHVILGDILSPGQTQTGVRVMLDWLQSGILHSYAKMT